MWLTVVSDGKPQETVEVVGTAFTIGREDSCDLVLDDPKVSRRHASITAGLGPTRDLRDLGSANGTLVNGAPIKLTVGFASTEERMASISGGEVLQFGDSIVLATLVDPREIPVDLPTAQPPGA
jgi:pSer/pThr/pTyr-binding forkhead associated (FHA) protein